VASRMRSGQGMLETCLLFSSQSYSEVTTPRCN